MKKHSRSRLSKKSLLISRMIKRKRAITFYQNGKISVAFMIFDFTEKKPIKRLLTEDEQLENKIGYKRDPITSISIGNGK